MKVFYSLSPQLKKFSKNSVLALGIFDGLHLGHQKILETTVNDARKTGGQAGVMSFSPHPDKFFNKQPLRLIQTIEQRLEGFKKLGLDYSLILDLGRGLASLRGEDFVRKILKEGLNISEVVVGSNFRFGHHRSCGVKELISFGRQFDFKVKILKPVKKKGHLISSSLIRKCLEKGQVDQARVYLGRPYEIQGRVIKGQRLGGELGFPTANLLTENEILPRGVFISLALFEDRLLPAVSNIGWRPTLASREFSVEVHLLGQKINLYRKRLSLFLLKKLRAEKKFPSINKLKEQIATDVNQTSYYFQRLKAVPSDLLDFLPDLVEYKFFKPGRSEKTNGNQS
ncbi:MAG: bifunctional riboflavin kinase/FAD synthetase [Candidatus Saccharicenans sp.]|nr:bifunctional riboflavin kinase/FAD synthetase [Candidatus Aminicenantes bacterium]